MKTYDAIIIGSGQGGNPLAHKLADDGWTVALVEREHLGGTCVNDGCTPTKAMIASARVAHVARRAADFGVRTGDVAVDLAAVVARKDELVRKGRSGQEEQVARRPSLDLYRAHARFTDARTLDVGGEAIAGEHVFVNTGTRPRLPEFDGLSSVDVLTNRTIMDLTEVPDHLLVLGGSYIGLEFGQMFRRFGARVTVVDVEDRIAAREDADVSDALREALEAEGMVFHTGCRAHRAAATTDGLALHVEADDGTDRTLRGTHLLAAVGRVPNTDDLGLEAAGIETDERGYIRTDDRLRTNVPRVWAIGDVKGGPAFTHISYDDHLVVYENLVHGADRSIADRVVPYALFTDPELGRVGLTERQAREAGFSLKVGTLPMARVARAAERGETAGLMKVVVDADTDRLLGGAVLGPEGGELVQILMTAMRTGAPWTTFERAIYIHPTLAEGFFALMEAVEPVAPTPS